MRLLSRDTSVEAQTVQVAIWRRLSSQRKLEITAGAIRAGFGIKHEKAQVMDPWKIGGEVIEVFENENVQYLVGGSLASTIHGEPRFTQDVDLVVQLRDGHVPLLRSALGSKFYLSEMALKDAIQRRTCAQAFAFWFRSLTPQIHLDLRRRASVKDARYYPLGHSLLAERLCNLRTSQPKGERFALIHNETGFKVDLLVSQDRPFDIERFRRKVRIETEHGSFWVSSAEDIILVKLEWYRQGGEVSDRQLRDIHTVLLTQEDLDLEYMRPWAKELNVADLLEQVLAEHE